MTGLEQIDIKPKNKEIELQEVKDFFDGKNKNFPANENNLNAVVKEMDKNFREYSEYGINPQMLDQIYSDFREKIKNNESITQTDINLIKLYILLVKKEEVSFVVQKDFTKDEVVMREIKKIQPYYNPQVSGIQTYVPKPKQYVPETQHSVSTLPNVPGASQQRIEDITKERNLNPDDCNLPVFTEELNSTVAISHLRQRFEQNYKMFMSDREYQEMKDGIFKRNITKPEAYKQSYMDYEYATIAFQRYQKIVNIQFDKTIKDAGYASQKEFNDQMEIMSLVNTQIEKKKAQEYPDIDQIVGYLVQYQKEIFELTKKYGFSNEKKRQESESSYIAYHKEAEILVNNGGYEEKIQRLQDPKVTTEEEVKQYLEDINSVAVYNTELESLKTKYGKTKIETYGNYMTAVNAVTNKYGRENLTSRSNKTQAYQKMVKDIQNTFGPNGLSVPGMGRVDRNKYEKFSKLYQQQGLPKYDITSQALQKILSDPTAQNSPFSGVKAHADLQKQQQADTDLYRATRKANDIVGYTIANVLSSARNGFMDFTRGAGSSLGIMLLAPFVDDDRMAGLLYHKQNFDQACSFNLSSQMKAPPIDENGNWNLGFDNTVSLVSSQVVNMLMLISGAGAISEGIALGGAKAGVMISANVAGKIGLFSMAMIQQTGRSFTEAKRQGLSDDQAFEYAMLQSVVSSALELISPNNLISGQGKNTFKMIMKGLLKEGTEKELKTVGKLVLKDLGKEVLEENLQETLQLAVGNGINMWINSERGTQFDETLTLDNFTTTMLLTTLTTGIASTPGMIKKANSGAGGFSIEQKTEIKQSIIQDPLLYVGMISQINVLLGSENGFQDFSQQDLLDLKKELEGMYADLSVSQSRVDEVTGIDPEVIKANALLDDAARIAKAEELLGGVSLHPEMQEAIIAAHNQDGTIFNLNFSQIRARVEILSKAGFKTEQIRTLIKYGICGQAEAEVLDVNKDGVFDNKDVEVMRNDRYKKLSEAGLGFLIEEIKDKDWIGKDEIDNLINNRDGFSALGIDITKDNFELLSGIQDVDNLVRNKPILESKFGIQIDEKNINFLSRLKENRLQSIIANKPKIEELGILISGNNIHYLSKITETELDAIITNKTKIENLGIEISQNNINELAEIITEVNLDMVIANKSKIEELGIEINERNIDYLAKITETELDIVIANKSKIEELGIEIFAYDISKLVKITEIELDVVIENKKNIENLGMEINSENIKKISSILLSLSPDSINDMVDNIGRNEKMFQGVREGTTNKQEFRNMINQESEIVANIINTTIDKINTIENISRSTVVEVLKEVLKEICPQIKGMDGNIQFEIILGINQYIANVIAIEKYLNMDKYRNDPKRLLVDMYSGIDYSNIVGDVTVERNGATLNFYMDNELGYIQMRSHNENIVYEPNEVSQGFFDSRSKIPELKNTFTVINGAKSNSRFVEEAALHETRHGLNSLIFRDFEGDYTQVRAKDEIIAFMKGGRGKEDVMGALTYTGEGLGYTYDMKEGTDERARYVKDLKRDIDIAFRLKDANVPNYLDLLAITPRNQRPQLEKMYLQNTEKPVKKFTDHATILINERLTNLSGYTKNLSQKIGFYAIVQKYATKFESVISGDNSFIADFAKGFKNLVAKTKELFKNDPEITKELNDLGDIFEDEVVVQENNTESKTSKSTVDPEIVKANAILEDGPRLQKAEELLPSRKQTLVDENGKPTVLGEKVLNAHNNSKGGEIYKITPEQLTEKVRILKEAGFNTDEIRILIENGICGKVEMEVMDVNKNGVFDGSDVEKMGIENILIEREIDIINKYMFSKEFTEKQHSEIKKNIDFLKRNMDKHVFDFLVNLISQDKINLTPSAPGISLGRKQYTEIENNVSILKNIFEKENIADIKDNIALLQELIILENKGLLEAKYIGNILEMYIVDEFDVSSLLDAIKNKKIPYEKIKNAIRMEENNLSYVLLIAQNLNELNTKQLRELRYLLANKGTNQAARKLKYFLNFREEICKIDSPLLPSDPQKRSEIVADIMKILTKKKEFNEVDENITSNFITNINNRENILSYENGHIEDIKNAGGIQMTYTLKSFKENIKYIIQNESTNQQERILAKFGLELKDTNIFSGLPVYKNDIQGFSEVEKQLNDEIHKFLFENEVNLSSNFDKYKPIIKDIIKAIPEFQYIIGMRQHGEHEYSLDIHIMKVIQENINNQKYKDLSKSEKDILMIASILHDINKEESMIDEIHPIISSKTALSIVDRFPLSLQEKSRIVDLIENHHWLGNIMNTPIENMPRMINDIAYRFRSGNDFLLAKIFAESDLKAVSESFYGKFGKNLESPIIKEIERKIVEIQSLMQPVFTQSPNMDKVLQAGGEMIRIGEGGNMTTNIVVDLEKIMFTEGKSKEDYLLLVHAPSSLDDAFTSLFSGLGKGNDGVFSCSMIRPEYASMFQNRKQFVIMDSPNINNVVYASPENLDLGADKDTNRFKQNMIQRNGMNNSNRIFLNEQIKNKYKKETEMMITEDQYAEIFKEISTMSDVTKIHENIRIQKILGGENNAMILEEIIINTNKELASNVSGNIKHEISEIVITDGHPVAIGIKGNVEDMVYSARKLAQDNNLPIIIFKE